MRVRPEPLLLAVLAGASWGQGAPASVLQPRLGASLLVSDNLSSDPAIKDRGALLTLTPGFTYARRTSSLQASVDYGLSVLTPWRVADRPDGLQHRLNSSLKWASMASGLSLDGVATISRQNASAFGVPSTLSNGSLAGTLNQREVYALGLTPSWQTRVGALGFFQVSHRASVTNTRDSNIGDSNTQDSSVSFVGLRRGGFQWSLRANRIQIDPKIGNKATTEAGSLVTSWQPDVDWQFSANVGHERSDLRRREGESGSSYGLGVTWTPTPRTQLQARADERAYGRTHNLSFTQRFRRASISLSESRSVTEPGSLGSVGARTNYQFYFEQSAALVPDPLLRDAFVRQLLASQGLDPNGLASSGLITSSPALTRQRFVTGVWTTARSSWTVLLSRSDSTRFGSTLQGLESLAESSHVRLNAASLSAGYRLGATSSLSTVLQWQQNQGDTAAQSSESKSLSLNWSTRIASRQQLSVALRHGSYESRLRPFSENALVLGYQHLF